MLNVDVAVRELEAMLDEDLELLTDGDIKALLSFTKIQAKEAVLTDASYLRKLAPIFAAGFAGKKKVLKPMVLVTAGPPLTGKSSLLKWLVKDARLEEDIAEKYNTLYKSSSFHLPNSLQKDNSDLAQEMKGHDFVCIDPDVWGIYAMADNDGVSLTKDFYETYRAASIVLANLMLIKAIREKYSIAYGTTATSSHYFGIARALKNAGYDQYMFAVDADEAVRETLRIKRESQGLYQCTPEDFKAKRTMFWNNLRSSKDQKSLYNRLVDELGVSFSMYRCSEPDCRAEKGVMNIGFVMGSNHGSDTTLDFGSIKDLSPYREFSGGVMFHYRWAFGASKPPISESDYSGSADKSNNGGKVLCNLALLGFFAVGVGVAYMRHASENTIGPEL